MRWRDKKCLTEGNGKAFCAIMSIITDLAWIPPKIVAKSFCGCAHCLVPGQHNWS